MTLTVRPLPELDPGDPGPAVHHVDPLLSLSARSHYPLALFVVLAFILGLIRPCLSYLLCRNCLSSLAFPASPPPHPSSLHAALCIAHIPAHPSLILINVAGYSWVHTISVQAKQAPEAAFIYEEHFSSPLPPDMCSACSLMCSPFFGAVDSWQLWHLCFCASRRQLFIRGSRAARRFPSEI